jgi:hypothetical protein
LPPDWKPEKKDIMQNMLRMVFFRAVVCAGLCALASIAAADTLQLAECLTDNMVLQRDKPVVLWGWSAPAEAVEASFAGQTVKTTADATGRWQVTLAPHGCICYGAYPDGAWYR